MPPSFCLASNPGQAGSKARSIWRVCSPRGGVVKTNEYGVIVIEMKSSAPTGMGSYDHFSGKSKGTAMPRFPHLFAVAPHAEMGRVHLKVVGMATESVPCHPSFTQRFIVGG